MFGLITRLGVVLSVPAFSFMKKANASPVQAAVSQYPQEMILTACVFLLVVGCLASIVTPDPEGTTPTKPLVKFVYSLFGSISAFIYLVFYEKELSMVHAVWVGGVSFVSPAVVPSLKSLVFDLLPIAKQTLTKLFEKWIGASKGNGNE